MELKSTEHGPPAKRPKQEASHTLAGGTSAGPASSSISAGIKTILSLRRHNEETAVTLREGELIVFGRDANAETFSEYTLPAHISGLNLVAKFFTTPDKRQSKCHAVIWFHASTVHMRALHQGSVPPKNQLRVQRVSLPSPGWETVFEKNVPVPEGTAGDCSMPLDTNYLCVASESEFWLKVEWRFRELLCFACSPARAPLPEAGSEVVAVQTACNWGHTVDILWGGTLKDLTKDLLKPTRRLLFAGHADATDSNGGKTLGLTSPGGVILAALPPADAVAALLVKSSPLHGGLLELAYLDGCESEPLGRKCHQAGINVVMCWRTRVSDPAARDFAVRFFRCVANGDSYKDAFSNAVQHVATAVDNRGRIMYCFRDPPRRSTPAAAAAAAAAPPLPPPPPGAPCGVPLLLLEDGSEWTATAAGGNVVVPATP